MQKIFSPGTKVKVGIQFTQEIATMGKIYTVVAHQHTERGFVADQYIVMDSDGGVHRFSDHLLEEVPEDELTEGATLFEVIYAPYGTKAFSPRSDTVLRREKHGWMVTGHGYPLTDDELASYLPVYLVGSFL